MFRYIFRYFFDFIGRVYRLRFDNQCILLVFVFKIFRDFLRSQSKIFYFCTITGRAGSWENILRFTDMTEADSISRNKFMIADTYRTVFTFWNISTFLTHNTTSISFFVDKNANFLPLGKIFFQSLKRQLGKIRSNLLRHVYQKDMFFGSLYFVIKAFIIHGSLYVRIKKKE